MATFLKNLHGLAQGQLFNGGYLVAAAATALAAKDDAASRNAAQAANKDCRRRVPWPRLAAYR